MTHEWLSSIRFGLPLEVWRRPLVSELGFEAPHWKSLLWLEPDHAAALLSIHVAGRTEVLLWMLGFLYLTEFLLLRFSKWSFVVYNFVGVIHGVRFWCFWVSFFFGFWTFVVFFIAFGFGVVSGDFDFGAAVFCRSFRGWRVELGWRGGFELRAVSNGSDGGCSQESQCARGECGGWRASCLRDKRGRGGDFEFRSNGYSGGSVTRNLCVWVRKAFCYSATGRDAHHQWSRCDCSSPVRNGENLHDRSGSLSDDWHCHAWVSFFFFFFFFPGLVFPVHVCYKLTVFSFLLLVEFRGLRDGSSDQCPATSH